MLADIIASTSGVFQRSKNGSSDSGSNDIAPKPMTSLVFDALDSAAVSATGFASTLAGAGLLAAAAFGAATVFCSWVTIGAFFAGGLTLATTGDFASTTTGLSVAFAGLETALGRLADLEAVAGLSLAVLPSGAFAASAFAAGVSSMDVTANVVAAGGADFGSASEEAATGFGAAWALTAPPSVLAPSDGAAGAAGTWRVASASSAAAVVTTRFGGVVGVTETSAIADFAVAADFFRTTAEAGFTPELLVDFALLSTDFFEFVADVLRGATMTSTSLY
ncbi:hypothetical protein [Thalassospira alkalitolerans]|uniref:hypothetical protein n=1 Tax=Thalassospira alkalitolerans TaxID=1293890 RepID=UPI003AA916AF